MPGGISRWTRARRATRSWLCEGNYTAAFPHAERPDPLVCLMAYTTPIAKLEMMIMRGQAVRRVLEQATHRAELGPILPYGYGYSRSCELFRSFEQWLSPTMRQERAAGDNVFVD